MLYVIPTPVGNLGDMSPRAIETLKRADVIYAEDTRTSGNLLKHFGIEKPLVSFHKFNEHSLVEKALSQLRQGMTIALVSDAGTPGISDPGFLLSRACRENGIEIETLPGPTAFVPALINSGLPCERFFFQGFLPAKKGRQTELTFLASLPVTFIVYESPLRLVRTLGELSTVCGSERKASVSREISKLHGTTVNGTLSFLEEYFKLNSPKGEIVIVVEGDTISRREKKIHVNKYRQSSETGTSND